jgi:hypothetical protein
MAKQTVNIGTTVNDGTGDTIRNGGDKINDNFNEIYTLLGTGTALTSGISATASVVTLAGPSVTGVASFAAGSAAAPSITKTGDTNTGIFFSAADEVAVTTGGTQRLKVDNSTATFAGAITGGGLLTTGGNIVIPDAGTIGSASSTSAMTIASTGIVTFADDIVIKDAGTIGSASSTSAMTIASTGIVTFVDDIIIKDVGTIGSSTTPGAITVAANGDVTFSGSPTFPDGSINLADLDIDGGTDIGADLVDADLFIVDDGAGGTNRKVAASRIKTYIGSGAPRGYLSGMGLSNDTDTDHDILVGVGVVRDAADAVNIELTSAITKQIDASWAAGDDAGGLSSSLTLSADTWYHVHAIIVSGSADIGFDTSVTAANLVTDHSATAYRRIGSVLTDSSSNIIQFQQFGDEFIFDSQVNNLSSGSPGTTRLTQTVTAPLGIETRAILGIIAVVAGSNAGVRFTITHPGVTDAAATTNNLNNGGENSSNNNGTWASGTHIVRTNTSSQVAYRQDFGASVSINTNGYYDDRGQY